MTLAELSQVMTPVDKVFMLDQNLNLDARVMQMILQNGHSRVYARALVVCVLGLMLVSSELMTETGSLVTQ